MLNKIVSKPSKHFSPLRYPGGKSCLAKYFSKLIESNNLVNCTYVEPYAGGAGAALQLLFLEQVERIVINDLDRSIYAFWWSILKRPNQFIDKLNKINLSIKEWSKQKNIINDSKSTLFDRGFATFYLNRTNRSGILEGGPIGGKKQAGTWKIDARFNKDTLTSRISTISNYSKRIKLFNLDGIDLLKKIYKEKDTFVYLDPPYYVKGADLYLNHYKLHDHSKLSKFLNYHSKFNWILTYDNIADIRKLYHQRKIINFNINYSAKQSRVGKEVMIFSDRLVN